MAAKTLMNVHEILEYLENLDVFSVDDLSDYDDFISRGRLVVLPPNNKGDRHQWGFRRWKWASPN